MPRSLRLLTGLALALVIALVAISSYIRLAHSGLGCEVWPQCYSYIGQPHDVSALNPAGGAGPPVPRPRSWAQPVHRLLASSLGIVILTLLAMTWMTRRRWRASGQGLAITTVLFVITMALAWLGIHSGHLHNPAIVMGNLLGGFSMLLLLGWLFLASIARPMPKLSGSRLRQIAWLVLLLLVAQIALGGLTGANFAATACTTFPDCHGQWLPDEHLMRAMDLSRSVEVDVRGYAIGGAERSAIHLAHRSLAWLLAIAMLMLVVSAWRRRLRAVALGLLVLISAELGVGIAAIYTQLPIGLAVVHNWLGGLLLLGTLWLLALSRETAAA